MAPYKHIVHSTLVRAINHIAVALNSRAYVEKVERCSSKEACGADALSKGDYKKFRDLFPDSEVLPQLIPNFVKWWVMNPVQDDVGRKVCLELRANGMDVLKAKSKYIESF